MSCIDRGLRFDGELPGGLRVRRRAKMLLARFEADRLNNARPPHEIMDRLSLFAIAVNEENAAGGRVVTAPTNGAAGVAPAVLRYYRDYCPGASDAGHARLPVDGDRGRRAVQDERVDLGRRSRLSGRSRRRLLDGRRGTRRSARRQQSSRSKTPPRSAWSIISA